MWRANIFKKSIALFRAKPLTVVTRHKLTSAPVPTFLSASPQMMDQPREASAVKGYIPMITMHTRRLG